MWTLGRVDITFLICHAYLRPLDIFFSGRSGLLSNVKDFTAFCVVCFGELLNHILRGLSSVDGDSPLGHLEAEQLS